MRKPSCTARLVTGTVLPRDDDNTAIFDEGPELLLLRRHQEIFRFTDFALSEPKDVHSIESWEVMVACLLVGDAVCANPIKLRKNGKFNIVMIAGKGKDTNGTDWCWWGCWRFHGFGGEFSFRPQNTTELFLEIGGRALVSAVHVDFNLL